MGGHPQTVYVYGEADSGKAKRIRRSSRMRIAPCDMSGKLLGDWIEAHAEIFSDEEAEHGVRLLTQRCFWKRLFDLFSRFKRRGHGVFAIDPA